MKRQFFTCSFLVIVLAIGLAFSGCSSKADLLQEVSGQWKSNENNDPVDIQLVGNTKTMKVNGDAYPITIDKVEMDKYQVDLKVKNGGSQPELWTLRQIWDDNGVSFKLSLKRGDKSEVLVRRETS